MALKSGLTLSHATNKELGTGRLLLLEKMELAVLVRDLLQRSKQPEFGAGGAPGARSQLCSTRATRG